MNGEGTHFGTLNIGEAIGGIEQQAARGGVQGNGDGVEGEIAAAQIFHDGGPANLGTRSGTNVMVDLRRRDFSLNAIAIREKSRRRKSSMMVDQRISGRVPGRT